MTEFTKREILQQIQKFKEWDSVMDYIFKKLDIDICTIDDQSKVRLKGAIISLKGKYKDKWQAAKRLKDRFELKNASWLNSDFNIPKLSVINHLKNDTQSKSCSGRPKLKFEDKCARAKRREILEINPNRKHDPQSLLMACRQAASRTGNRDLYSVITHIVENIKEPEKIRKLMGTSIKKKSPEEALAFLLDNSLTKTVYTNMRLETKSSGADIWPIYDEVRKIKSQCRPPKEHISISENKVEVSLQALLHHTTSRIVELQKEVILHHMLIEESTEMEAVLICSWGFDGSSGHSGYKQRYQSLPDENLTKLTDENLFATTIIPQRLLSKDGAVLWNNRSPQSIRFCRPLTLEYIPESPEVILRQKDYVEKQIDELQSYRLTVDDIRSVSIHFSLFLTLIDGKVLNIITGTKSMQTCPICHATPKLFNDLSKKSTDTFLPDPKSLMYGISPLHAWIRVFECLLKISYRQELKVWQMRTVDQKMVFAEKKKKIQAILRTKLGLIVDKPVSGGSGNSNDGNTARRAFEKPEILAECLGIDCELIKLLKTILIAISIHLPIDPMKFGRLCDCAAERYISIYSWYPMPATLHKLLVHGADIISTSILPVGVLGEEASEARNKDYKNFRLHHARDINIGDVFYRAMDTSDVKISSISLEKRLKQKKQLSIPTEVRDLLCSPEVKYCENETSGGEDEHGEVVDNAGAGLPEILCSLDEIVLSDDDDEDQYDEEE